MKSMKADLTRLFYRVAFPMAIGFLAITYWAEGGALENRFDESLAIASGSLATLVRADSHGIEFDFADELVPYFQNKDTGDYFAVWVSPDQPPERSHSLGENQIELRSGPLEKPAYWDQVLDDGTVIRCCGVEYKIVPDPDGSRGNAGLSKEPIPATIVVGKDRGPLDASLLSLLLWDAALALGFFVVFHLTVKWAIHRGMKPIQVLKEMISEMDPANPKSVCDESMLPQELLAIGHGVNQLAERVEKAMQREKRTTSSLAHELMTPISELRSMVEINKMYPEDPEVRNNFYRRTDRIVSEMQVMAEKVVQMARYEDAVDELQNREFDLLVEVENGLDLVAQRVREKGLHISFDSCLDSIVFGDQAIAKIVVGNLIANAVSHCPQGGHLGVRFETDESNLWLHLSNTNWGLEPQDLEFITERYWHKGPEGQAAKTGSGLGLALVHDLTAHAGFEFEFGLRGTDVLVRLGIPLAAAAEQESD